MEIAPGIHHIRCPFGASVVHVTAIIPERADDPAGITLIDSGVAQVPAETLAPYLAQVGRSLADVRRVLLTHGHIDHAGGNGPVKAASGAQLWIHPADRRQAEDPLYHYEALTGRWLRLAGLDDSAAVRGPAAYVQLMAVAPIDGSVSDGDEFDCGPVHLRAVHTPGHTPGSVCYYWPEGRLLVAGDAIQGAAWGPGGFPIVLDLPAYMASMDRLRRIEIDTLLTAHPYRTTQDDGVPVRQGAEVRRFLDESAEVAGMLAAAIEAVRGLPPAELVAAVVERLRPRLATPPGEIPAMARPTALAAVFPVEQRAT
ncbi:MAG: MBL fold metallo-hydrolase [Chloroflexi bacterium]|nr:MBL fold metallo-hydrolase [Chloroflexota bacterium]